MGVSRFFIRWFIKSFSILIFVTNFGLYGLPPVVIKELTDSNVTDSIKKHWGITQTDLAPTEWKAYWIWRRGESQGTNLLLLARKSFDIKTQPDKATLYISADNHYELYVNGRFVNRGPARCQPNNQSYDILELASLLKPGNNVLAIRALHQGRYFGIYNTPPRPGLLAQLEIKTSGKQEIIISDSSWKVKKPENINLNSSHYGETVDFRRDDKGWQDVNYDDSHWDEADELMSDRFWPWPEPSSKSTPRTITVPWITLVPRDLPYLRESLVKGKNLYEDGEILELGFNNPIAEGAHGLLFPREKCSMTGIEAYQNDKGPISIQNSYPTNVFSSDGIYSTYLVFDLKEGMHGYPHLELEGNAGTIVEILYAPHLLRGKFPLRTDISGRPLTDRIILGKGKTVWDALEAKYLRYMLIAIRNTNSPVKLYYAGIKRVDYPFEEKGYISIPKDNDIEWLWEAAINTLRAVTTDAFADNYRENIQYAQTSYYAARANYSAFGDTYLQRRYLIQIAQLQQSDGILPASAPITAYRGQRFLDGSIFWIMGLKDYFLYTGDLLTTRELLPSAKRILDRLFLWENKDGFIDSPPYPYWIDHANLDRSGANFALNSLYLLAMQDYTSLVRWTGDNKEADDLIKRIENLRVNLRNKFWDPEHKLFSDARIGNELSSTFSEQSNSLAIVAGIATTAQQNEILKEFLENKSARMVPAVLFMHYIAESLFMTGHGEEALSLLKDRYREMKHEGSGTLWEDWSLTGMRRSGRYEPNSGRCNIQAENTFLAHSLTCWLLGIQPTNPGMTEIILFCNQCGLDDLKGSMPCPQGIISIAWEKSKKNKLLEVEIPKGVKAFVDLVSLKTNKKMISLDGNSISVSTSEGGKLELSSGKHILEF